MLNRKKIKTRNLRKKLKTLQRDKRASKVFFK